MFKTAKAECWRYPKPVKRLLGRWSRIIGRRSLAIETSLFQVGVVLVFGVLGYVMKYFRFPFLPMVLGVVLGFLVESNFRRALVLFGDDYTTFLRNPIAVALLAVAALFILGSLLRHVTSFRPHRPVSKVTP